MCLQSILQRNTVPQALDISAEDANRRYLVFVVHGDGLDIHGAEDVDFKLAFALLLFGLSNRIAPVENVDPLHVSQVCVEKKLLVQGIVLIILVLSLIVVNMGHNAHSMESYAVDADDERVGDVAVVRKTELRRK